MDGKLCSNASAGKAPEATLAAALILSFFLRITVSMPAPSRPLHRGKRTIAVDKSCHLPLWKQVPRLHLALTVEANVVRLCIAILDRAMKITFAGCVLLTIFSLSAPSRPSDSWIHESKLLALENAWNQAQLHHDSKALDSLVSDTFVYTDYDGTVMNKAQFLADLKDPTYRATLITNEGMKVFSYQDMAIVIGRYHTKGSYKRKPFEHYGRFTDTWVYQNTMWRCVASHTSLIEKK